MTHPRAICLVAASATLAVAFVAPATAQAPPTGIQPFKPVVPTYNGTLETLHYIGGSQQELYSDGSPAVIPTDFYSQIVNISGCGFSPPHYHPGLTELNYVLEGSDLIAAVIAEPKGTMGYGPFFRTGLTAGQVAIVPLSAVHYAENPTCNPVRLLQVFQGLAQDYTTLPYVDLPTSLLSLAATDMGVSYALTNDGLHNAIQRVQPLLDVNPTCQAACAAAGTPSTAAG